MKLKFLPQEERFFELFDQSAQNVVKGAELLLQLVSDHGRAEELRKEIEEVEHEGDIITHDIADRLNRTFITPFDHEDIHALEQPSHVPALLDLESPFTHQPVCRMKA